MHGLNIPLFRIHGKSKLVTIGVNKQGEKIVTGNSSRLKSSAHYPFQFGLAVASLIHPIGKPETSPDPRIQI